jgi:hypothetical protein
MIKINKTLVVTAALIAVGFVAVNDLAQSRTQLSAAATVSARFPSQSEMMLVRGAATQAGVPETAAEPCVREHWPYIADECLTATDGAKVKRPTRTIPIERRIAGASSLVAAAQ